jgi:heterodisulfide reductase subunit B
MLQGKRGGNHLLPSILYPQLLGLTLGMESRVLGLGMNHIEMTAIVKFLSE